MNLKKGGIWKILVLIAVTVLIFYFLFKKISLSAVIGVFKNSDWFLIIAALAISLLFLTAIAHRWKIIIKTMGYKITYKRAYNVILGTQPINTVTPSKAGDLFRAYCIKDTIPITKTLGTILTEKFLDFLTLTLFSLIGLIILLDFKLIYIPLIILFALLILVFLTSLKIKLPVGEKWNQRLRNLFLSLRVLTKNKKNFAIILWWSFINWISSIIQIYIFFIALHNPVPFSAILAYLPLSIFIGLIPITIGGMGTRDSAIIVLFAAFAPASILLSMGILYSLAGYWIFTLIGWPFMRKLFKET